MSDKPVLLFLHGVGDGDPGSQWKTVLEKSLTRSGYPNLDGTTVIVPLYAHALKGCDEPKPLPVRTIKAPGRDAAKLNRRDFERRLASVEHRIGRQDQEHFINEALANRAQTVHNVFADAVVALPFFQ
ncbi:hypothetical protein [Specibacter sp. NPDC078692]|uniref:hypothetical protein n=1 Tax=Specibacter sp. NPDC078692 TaxID=3155818 RepID=UPI00343F8350